MFTVFIIGLLVVIGTILWMKKFQWQGSNPFAYVLLLLVLGIVGLMLIPEMPDILVPDFLENWAYIDAYADGPGGMSHMLFWGTMIILLIVGGIVSRLGMRAIRGQKTSIAYLLIFGIALIMVTGTIGMNLKGMNVDTARIVGEQVTPVAQQAVVSTMNAGGDFLNKLGQGFQAQEVHAPQHVINRAGQHLTSKKIADMPSFQPWKLKQESDKQSGTPTPYQSIPNDVDVGARSSKLNQSSGDYDYNPADFEPAEDPQPTSESRYTPRESTNDYWNEVDQSSDDKKKDEKKERPLRYRSGPSPN